MVELKTKVTTQKAEEYINTLETAERVRDGKVLITLFKKITGQKPLMWGTSIIGFGVYHYKSERSTQEGDWPLVAFSPRKQNFTLYINANQIDKKTLTKLGKHKVSGSCLHIKRMSDVDTAILGEFIKKSFEFMKKNRGC